MYREICNTLYWAGLWAAPDVYFPPPPNEQTSHRGRPEEVAQISSSASSAQGGVVAEVETVASCREQLERHLQEARNLPPIAMETPHSMGTGCDGTGTGTAGLLRMSAQAAEIATRHQLEVAARPHVETAGPHLERFLQTAVDGSAAPTLPTHDSLLNLIEQAINAAEKVQCGWPAHLQQHLQGLPEAGFSEQKPARAETRLGICICSDKEELKQLKVTLPILLVQNLIASGCVRVFLLIAGEDRQTLEWLKSSMEGPIRSHLLTVFVTKETEEWHFSRWYNCICNQAAEYGATVASPTDNFPNSACACGVLICLVGISPGYQDCLFAVTPKYLSLGTQAQIPR